MKGVLLSLFVCFCEGTLKLVGMEYETWFLSADAGQWANRKVTPARGTYSSHDPAVLDSHLQQMGQQGIDFILVDWSNQRDPAQWPNRPDLQGIVDATDLLFDRALVNPIGKPQIAIMIDCLDSQVLVNGWARETTQIIVDHYLSSSRKNMYFAPFAGVPLLAMYVMTPAWSANCGGFSDPRFAVRYVTGFTEAQNLQGQGVWSWISRNPIGITMNGRNAEVATVSPATCQMPGDGSGPRGGGAYYTSQWQQALAADPYIIMICQWNEYAEETSPECSNEVEDTVEYGTTYGDLTKQFIAQFKAQGIKSGYNVTW